MADRPYQMTLDLNVLNHLGINLYSNVPAVLAEAVANTWDADAETVDIDIDPQRGEVVIADDGCGMSKDEINAKYLRVGRDRRKEEPLTARNQRPVMGRKGIGKLSLFSIADVIEVQSYKDGQSCGFTMSLPDIREKIQDKPGGDTYYPEPLTSDEIDVSRGTKITLRNLRKQLHSSGTYLRRRLARRFSVIGPDHNFAIRVDGKEVSVQDRHFYPLVEFLWHYGDYGKECVDHCSKLKKSELREDVSFQGWIGTVEKPSQLRDEGESLNRIPVLARGKLVHEDILKSFEEAGLFTKYLIGEVAAEGLDVDDDDDIATTSRQSVVEDDPRFIVLQEEVHRELRHIRDRWTSERNAAGTKEALENTVIREWFEGLGSDEKNRAERIFGKINELTVDNPDHRAELFKQGVLAFEILKAKANLDALEEVTGENIVEFGKVFGTQDELEATFYHQIVQGRLRVISALQEMVDENDLEKVIQQHLFDHLWLLDASWERATATEYMEKRVATAFSKVDAQLSEKEKKGRIDIRYRTTAGKHVIVELKRAAVVTNTPNLMEQVDSYRAALHKLLAETGETSPHIDTVCVVGKPLSDWAQPDGRRESELSLKPKSIRVVTYQSLIEQAQRAYLDFLKRSQEAGRIVGIWKRISDEIGD